MNILSRKTTNKHDQRFTSAVAGADTVDTGLPIQSGLVAGNAQIGELMACASKCNKDRDCMKECRDQIAPDLEIPAGLQKQFS